MTGVADEACAGILAAIGRYGAALAAIGAEPPPAPRWDQDWFPRLDAAAAYAMVRRHRPRRIVEVGSGHSTRFLARAAADERLDTRITAIDPQPRAALKGLDIERIPETIQEAGETAFAALASEDILFIDSSHVVAPGSDVDFLLGMLSRLPPGLRIHFHDIFLPDPYPAHWAWRRYNEQDAVAALLETGEYAIEFSSHWVVTRMRDALASGVLTRLPLVPGAIESSLWLRKLGSDSTL